MRSSARSRGTSRRSTRAAKRRPSLSTTSATGRLATCAFVTIAPSLAQITPEPAPSRPSRTATVLAPSFSASASSSRSIVAFTSVVLRALADGDLEVLRRSAAAHVDADLRADGRCAELRVHVVRIFDGVALDRGDHVADEQAAALRGTVGRDAKHDRTALHAVQRDTEIAARNPAAAGEQRVDDAPDRGDPERSATGGATARPC